MDDKEKLEIRSSFRIYEKFWFCRSREDLENSADQMKMIV